MNVRLWILSLVICLAATRNVSAVVVSHEFSGVVAYSNVSGVAVNDPFTVVLTYDTNQPDLEPADSSIGRYAGFTLSLDVGPISVSETNPEPYDLGIRDGAPGSPDGIVWAGGIGPGNIGLSAGDQTGTAFNSDALPLSLNMSSFSSAGFRHFVTGSTRVDGTILSISSRIVPEPSSLAIMLIALSGSLLRRHLLPTRLGGG